MTLIKRFTFISLLLFAFISVNAHAKLSTTDQEYISNLKSGDLRKIKRAAKLIIRNQTRTQQVLDVAAEVLFEASTKISRPQVHTYTHLARAIGESLDGRYYTILKEVKEITNSKHVRKWAKWAYKNIGKKKAKGVAQYKQGTIRL